MQNVNNIDYKKEINITTVNNSNYKQEVYIKSTTTLNVFDFNNPSHQEEFTSDKYSAHIFTPSIRVLRLIKEDAMEEMNLIFEDLLIEILLEYTGYKYIDSDIAIVITPNSSLKNMLGNNYQPGYAYFVSLIDGFIMIFD